MDEQYQHVTGGGERLYHMSGGRRGGEDEVPLLLVTRCMLRLSRALSSTTALPSRTSSMSSLSSPPSLQAALDRIKHLESQLHLATALLESRGVDFHTTWQHSQTVTNSLDASTAINTPSASNDPLPTSSFASSTPFTAPPPSSDLSHPPPTAAAPADSTPEFDIGPLILRAIALRKDLHVGRVEDADAEGELRKILEDGGEGLDEAGRETVRKWAGL